MTTAVASVSPRRSWRPRATVGWVRDGDTFVASHIDLGWGLGFNPPRPAEPGYCAIRLLYAGGHPFDAPERSGATKEWGLEAANHLAGLLPPGTVVDLDSYGFDNFGRTLAAVTLPDGWDAATRLHLAGFSLAPPPKG